MSNVLQLNITYTHSRHAIIAFMESIKKILKYFIALYFLYNI